MKDEEKLDGLIGRTIIWVDLDDGFVHMETDDGLIFHIPYDQSEEIDITGELPN